MDELYFLVINIGGLDLLDAWHVDYVVGDSIYCCYCLYVDCSVTFVMPCHLVGPSPQVDDPRTPGPLGLRIAGRHTGFVFVHLAFWGMLNHEHPLAPNCSFA